MKNTQFSIAVHVLAGIAFRGGGSVPSPMISHSVNTCPSFVRRVLAKLSKAGLVRTSAGKTGGCSLARTPKTITLLDIYRAVGAPKIFAIHDYPTRPHCAVSCGIKTVMESVRDRAQKSMEERLSQMTLADVLSRLQA